MAMKFKYALILLSALLAAVSCKEAADYTDTIYIAGSEQDNPSLSMAIDDQFPKEMGITVSSSTIVDKDITVELKADPAKAEDYNRLFGKNYALLPEECYELLNTSLVIKKGAYASDKPMKLTITSKAGIEEGKNYILPVSISGISGDISTMEGFNTVYVIVNQIIITPAADISSSAYFAVDFSKPSKYDTKALPSVTYEARIYIPAFTSFWCNTVMGLEENFVFRFVQDDHKGQLQIAGGGYAISSKGAIAAGTWGHAACIFDGTTGITSIYINGVLDVSAPTPRGPVDLTSAYNQNMFWIGASAGDKRYMKGYISEARVWARALSPGELRNNMCYVDPTSKDLVAYWRFNDGVTGLNRITDLTGNGYDAQLVGGGGSVKWVTGVRCPE